MQVEGFKVIDEDALVLYREYAFTKGASATTLVFRGKDGLVVVSPSSGVTARELDALAEHGEVSALIANNGYHHLGQAAWRERFPNAVSYAPAATLPRLRKKSSGIPYRALSELALPAHVRCEETAGFKGGDAFLSIRTKRGNVWYTGDLVTNIQSLPPPPVRWLFSWTDSAPGLRLFRPAVWLLIRDKKEVRAWMLERLASDPPSIVVPAHGPPCEAADVVALTRLQLERL